MSSFWSPYFNPNVVLEKVVEQNKVEHLGKVRLLSQRLAKPGTCEDLNRQNVFHLFHSQFILR